MLYHTTWLISKLDPLKFMIESPALSERLTRWQVLLSEYGIVYVSQKAIKGSAIADFIASRTVQDYEPLSFHFSDEDLMCIHEESDEDNEVWKMSFDGASNAKGHGVGFVLISPSGKHYPLTARLEFECTNNVAEYEACVLGLQATIEKRIKKLKVYGDSSLVIYQL